MFTPKQSVIKLGFCSKLWLWVLCDVNAQDNKFEKWANGLRNYNECRDEQNLFFFISSNSKRIYIYNLPVMNFINFSHFPHDSPRMVHSSSVHPPILFLFGFVLELSAMELYLRYILRHLLKYQMKHTCFEKQELRSFVEFYPHRTSKKYSVKNRPNACANKLLPDHFGKFESQVHLCHLIWPYCSFASKNVCFLFDWSKWHHIEFIWYFSFFFSTFPFQNRYTYFSTDTHIHTNRFVQSCILYKCPFVSLCQWKN